MACMASNAAIVLRGRHCSHCLAISFEATFLYRYTPAQAGSMRHASCSNSPAGHVRWPCCSAFACLSPCTGSTIGKMYGVWRCQTSPSLKQAVGHGLMPTFALQAAQPITAIYPLRCRRQPASSALACSRRRNRNRRLLSGATRCGRARGRMVGYTYSTMYSKVLSLIHI